MKAICEICKKEFEHITHTHLKKHDISSKEYKIKFPNSGFVSDEYKRKISDKLIGRKFTDERNKKQSNSLKQWYEEHPEVLIQKSERIKGDKNPAKRPEIKEKMRGQRPWLQGDNNPSRRPEVVEKLSGQNNHFYGKHHTPEAIQKIKNKHHNFSGDKNPNWNGGLSFKPYCYRFNEQLKEEIRKRDNYQCQHPDCLITQLESKVLYSKALIPHHVHYDKENCYPDLITLCSKHNSVANGNRDYHEELFMKILKERNLLNYFGDI